MPPREKTPEKSSAGIIRGMAPLSKLNKTVLRKKDYKGPWKKKTLTPNDKELGWIYAQEYMKAGGDKTTRKLLNTADGRADYLMEMYKDETEASKKRTETQKKMTTAILEGKDDKAIKSIKRTKEPITYTVKFRVLTNNLEKVKEAQIDKGKTRKSGRNVILNSVKYTQVGSKQSFETTDKWFIKNWHQGTKADHIVKSKRGAEGSRWRRAIKHVEPALRERRLGEEGFGKGFGDPALLLSYMEALYIADVYENKKTETADVKTEEKNNDAIQGYCCKYLYKDLSEEDNKYENHPYLKKHYKKNSCLLTAIIEAYYETFTKKKSDGKRMYKEDITYEYLCELFGLECTEDNIGCRLQTALFSSKSLALV